MPRSQHCLQQQMCLKNGLFLHVRSLRVRIPIQDLHYSPIHVVFNTRVYLTFSIANRNLSSNTDLFYTYINFYLWMHKYIIFKSLWFTKVKTYSQLHFLIYKHRIYMAGVCAQTPAAYDPEQDPSCLQSVDLLFFVILNPLAKFTLIFCH